MCISIEILGRFSEDVYFNGDKYILVKLNTWVELIGDRKQYLDLDTFNKFGCQRNEFEQESCDKKLWTCLVGFPSEETSLSGDSHPFQIPCVYNERFKKCTVSSDSQSSETNW